jgi:hypothetical protein
MPNKRVKLDSRKDQIFSDQVGEEIFLIIQAQEGKWKQRIASFSRSLELGQWQERSLCSHNV